MSVTEYTRSTRITSWVKYPLHTGKGCRVPKCKEFVVADTTEGFYCLEHYVMLPACVKCGEAASARLCGACHVEEDSRDPILQSSSLSGLDEASGHSTFVRGRR